MDAVIYKALNEIESGTLTIPSPSDHDLVLKIRASGVCHTDIDILNGRYGNGTFPIVPGHEYAGEIVELGSNVTGFSIGDRVVVDPNFGCMQCRYCTKGKTNLCDQLGAYGVTLNGGFEEFSAVNENNVIPIDDLPFDVAALAEPMACVLNGVDTIRIDGVETALVFGAGPIGLLMAIALRTKGVNHISLVDINESRLELAESFGFSAIASGSQALEKLHQEIDLVVDATGLPSVAGSLINYAVNGGRVLFFGVCPPNEKVQIAPFEVFRRQITIAGAHSLNRNIPDALQSIRSFGPDISRLISHRVALDEIPDFLNRKGPKNSLKIQAVW